MIGMKERVVLLGGKINVKSEIGKGTTIAVSMPWK
jgi:signal transduction histidine kinase